MKKVVVTGGAGFIGSSLARDLKACGHEVHIIDSLVGGKRENVPEGAIFHEIDICDEVSIKNLFEKVGNIHAVFHLAALPRVQYSIKDPIKTNHTNVSGTLNLLKASVEAKVRKFIYSASSSAYGDQNVTLLHEGLPPNPKSPYGLQKHIGELYSKLWSEVYGLPTTSLRYFNVYGPGLNPEGEYALVIGKFLKQRQEGKTLTITGDGTQTRNFTHVSDVVRANILAMESENVGRGEVINIGSSVPVSINELAKIIGGPIEYIPPRLEPKHNMADNSLAKKLLSWEPTVSLEEGLFELKKIFNLI